MQSTEGTEKKVKMVPALKKLVLLEGGQQERKYSVYTEGDLRGESTSGWENGGKWEKSVEDGI